MHAPNRQTLTGSIWTCSAPCPTLNSVKVICGQTFPESFDELTCHNALQNGNLVQAPAFFGLRLPCPPSERRVTLGNATGELVSRVVSNLMGSEQGLMVSDWQKSNRAEQLRPNRPTKPGQSSN